MSGGNRTAYDSCVTNAQDERAALAALLDETGPDGPTLCEGWQTRDLAAHLVLRERRPDAAVGMMGGPLAGYTARVQQQYLDRYPYPELIAMFQVRAAAAVAVRDPRRGRGGQHRGVLRAPRGRARAAAADWTERELPARPVRGAVEAAEGRAAVPARRADRDRAGPRADGKRDLIVAEDRGAELVTVTGTPAELTLWSMGRVSAAQRDAGRPARTPSRKLERLAALAAGRQ